MRAPAFLPLWLAVLMAAAPLRSPPDKPCLVPAPAGLHGPGRWFGLCPDGRAEGMGVLRTGVAKPFGFFAGRMSAGRPGPGLVIRPDGLFVPAAGFDASGHPLPTDSLRPEQQDRLFALAANAAQATAGRFAQIGDRMSAAYYRKLAARIRNGLPE